MGVKNCYLLPVGTVNPPLLNTSLVATPIAWATAVSLNIDINCLASILPAFAKFKFKLWLTLTVEFDAWVLDDCVDELLLLLLLLLGDWPVDGGNTPASTPNLF